MGRRAKSPKGKAEPKRSPARKPPKNDDARVRELEKQAVPDGEVSSAEAGDRIAYGILVAALENGLVKTLQEAVDVLKRFSAPAGALGEQWLREQQKKLGPGA